MVARITPARTPDPPLTPVPFATLDAQRRYHESRALCSDRHDNPPAAAYHEHLGVLCAMMAQSEVAAQ